MLSHPTSRLGRIGAIVAFTLVAAVVIPAAPALAATGEACPNEAVRAESNISPLTGQPYDIGLPECRAYEMVSPLEKQQHDALSIVSPPRSPTVSRPRSSLSGRRPAATRISSASRRDPSSSSTRTPAPSRATALACAPRRSSTPSARSAAATSSDANSSSRESRRSSGSTIATSAPSSR